jgi:hypothetical protein
MGARKECTTKVAPEWLVRTIDLRGRWKKGRWKADTSKLEKILYDGCFLDI